MNVFLLLAKAFLTNQAHDQIEKMKNVGLHAAETGRRMAIKGVFYTVAIAFFFSALILAAIEIGLQIERNHSLSFSGLIVSSLIIGLFGLFAILLGWIWGRVASAQTTAQTTAPAPPPPPPARSELHSLLESVAVALLREFLEHRAARPPTAESNQEEAS